MSFLEFSFRCTKTMENVGGQFFEYGITQSNEQAKSGKYSAKLNQQNPYGMSCFLSEVQKDEQYKISVWVLNKGNKNTALVVTAIDSVNFYLTQNKPDQILGDWMKYEISFVVSENMHNRDLKIYCRNRDSFLPAFFDDLSIERR